MGLRLDTNAHSLAPMKQLFRPSHLLTFFIPMKSAYELAMERLQKGAPVAPLTDAQRAEIAEIDSTYKAKIAEKELLLKDQIKKEMQAGHLNEVEPLQQQLATELRRLQEECESRKEKIRNRPAK